MSEWWDGSIKTVDRGYVWPNSGAVTALMGNVDIPERFDSMATAMTDYIRYGPNKQNATGETIQSVPYVLIQWWYFVCGDGGVCNSLCHFERRQQPEKSAGPAMEVIHPRSTGLSA